MKCIKTRATSAVQTAEPPVPTVITLFAVVIIATADDFFSIVITLQRYNLTTEHVAAFSGLKKFFFRNFVVVVKKKIVNIFQQESPVRYTVRILSTV